MSGGAGSAHFPVHIEARAENGRVADASRDFPRQAAGGRYSRDGAFGVQPDAMDRAVEVLRLNQSLRDHCLSRAMPRLRALLRFQEGRPIRPPLPLQPKPARLFRVQIVFDLEVKASRETLRVRAYQ